MKKAITVLITILFPLLLWGKHINYPPGSMSKPVTGTLVGTVKNAEGVPLSQASVFLPALERGATTNEDGVFRVAGLPAQPLRLSISFLGYQTVVRRVQIPAGETKRITVTLTRIPLQAEKIVVTGTPSAQEQLTATQQVDVVTPQELKDTRTAALGDVLEKNVAGAASIKTGSQSGKPVLRGLTGNRIRLLADGIGQEYYQFGVRHFPNTSLAEAGRIEIVRGPASILYGSDAIGGAINILPKALPSSGFGGLASTQYFANNNERSGRLELQTGTAISETTNFGIRAGGERRAADNFVTPESPTFFETGKGGRFGDPKYTGEIPFTNFNQWSAYAQAGIQGDFGTLQFTGDYWRNRHNFLLPTGGPDDDDPDSPAPIGLGQNIEHANLALKATFSSGGFVFKPRMSYQRAVRQSAGPGNTVEDIEAANGSFDYPINLEKDIYSGRLEVLHPTIGNFSGTIGLEAVYQDGQSKGPVPLTPTGTIFNFGLFAFEEISLDPLTLSAGLRLDVRRQEAAPPQSTIDALNIRSGDLENTYTALSGSAGLNYRLNEDLALLANLGAGFRAPTLFELYANGQHGGVAAIQQGDPNLSPERSYSADLGLRLRSGKVRGEITGYYNFIQEYIYLQNTGENQNPDGSGPPIYASGQTDANLAGLDGALQWQVLSWLQLGAEASLISGTGENLEENSEGDQILPLLPANRFGGHLRVEPQFEGAFKAAFAQLRIRHATDKDAAGTYEPFSQFDNMSGPPPFGTASTRAYTLVDVSAGTTVRYNGLSVELTIGANNLLDETYRNFLDTYKGYALSPGRNVYVMLSVPFGTGQ